MPFLHVDINRDAAARLGVTVPDILAVVEAVGGHVGKPVTVQGAIIPTQVRLRADAVNSPERIGHLQVRRADGKAWVLLSQVADISLADGVSRIDRDNIHRRVIVQANVRGRDVSSFVAAAQAEVARKVTLPHGYRLVWAGQFRNLQSAMHRLVIVVPVALALIFLLLVAALGSFGAAALVFANLPMAATGGSCFLQPAGCRSALLRASASLPCSAWRF